jgi:hypothetical protein
VPSSWQVLLLTLLASSPHHCLRRGVSLPQLLRRAVRVVLPLVLRDHQLERLLLLLLLLLLLPLFLR